QSEEIIRDDDTNAGTGATGTVPSNIAAVTEPNITATTESHTPLAASSAVALNDATASPDPSDSAAATRRGLRTRRPAQQRPYSYDAQIFEEHETDVPEEDTGIQTSPHAAQSRQVSTISYGRGFSEEQLRELDEDTLAILQGDLDPESERDTGRPKHFKGKGRAWKKEESDEDMEFTVGKKKKKAAAAARAKAKGQAQTPKKRGRPRKTIMSEDLVRDNSDSDAAAPNEDVSPSPAASKAPAKKARKPPRKSALSEEIVRDDSESDTQPEEDTKPTAHDTGVSSPNRKKQGHFVAEDETSTTAVVAQPELTTSYTPKGTLNKSYTPKGSPKYFALYDFVSMGDSNDRMSATPNDLKAANSPARSS
ncbi:hypothetical protein EK21DRAFT_76133, partial [Setomelanomma holmii]